MKTTAQSPLGEDRASLSDTDQLEYDQGNEWWRTLSAMRRRDIALFTAGQGAVLAFIGDRLLELQPDGWALSIVAFIISIVGLNNERRLYRYLRAFRKRTQDIEARYSMSLVTATRIAVRNLPLTVSSGFAFRAYYGLVALGWVALWVANYNDINIVLTYRAGENRIFETSTN